MKDPTAYVDETSDLSPVSLYAEMKVAVEKMILERPARGLAATALRFATVYGVSPRMRFDLTVNEFTMEMMVRGRLVVFGEQFWRPYLHVRDMARGVEAVLEAPLERVAGEVFNVGSTDENYQKKQLVELIRPYAPDAVVEYVQKQEDPRDYRVSFAKLESTLGFRASRRVPDGIREVAQVVTDGVIGDFNEATWRN
jgi:nucleoside-diphosphate-sugar epimerase